MQQRKQLTILLVLAAVSAICAALLWGTMPRTEEEEQPTVSVTDYSVGDVQAVLLINEMGTMGLINTADGVVVDGADSSVYSQQKLKMLIYAAAHMDAERIVSKGAGEDFGLEAPAAQVSLLLRDKTIRLKLGRQNPLTGEYYIEEEGGATYLVKEESAKVLLQTLDDLRELAPYPGITAENISSVSRITVTNGNGSFALELLPSGFYAMTQPVQTELNWERVSQYVLNPLRQLVPERFVSEGTPLSEYGLDSPECTVELTMDGKTWRCGFVQKGPETWYCANLDGTLVSELETSALSFASVDYLQLIGNTIFSKSIADLQRIGVKYNNKQFSVTISGEGSTLSSVIGNRQFDDQETVAFYRNISSVPAVGRFEESADVEPVPMLTLTMTSRNGTEDILEFHPVSERQCAVYQNGVANFTTYRTVVSDMIAALDTYYPEE